MLCSAAPVPRGVRKSPGAWDVNTSGQLFSPALYECRAGQLTTATQKLWTHSKEAQTKSYRPCPHPQRRSALGGSDYPAMQIQTTCQASKNPSDNFGSLCLPYQQGSFKLNAPFIRQLPVKAHRPTTDNSQRPLSTAQKTL